MSVGSKRRIAETSDRLPCRTSRERVIRHVKKDCDRSFFEALLASPVYIARSSSPVVSIPPRMQFRRAFGL